MDSSLPPGPVRELRVVRVCVCACVCYVLALSGLHCREKGAVLLDLC